VADKKRLSDDEIAVSLGGDSTGFGGPLPDDEYPVGSSIDYTETSADALGSAAIGVEDAAMQALSLDPRGYTEEEAYDRAREEARRVEVMPSGAGSDAAEFARLNPQSYVAQAIGTVGKQTRTPEPVLKGGGGMPAREQRRLDRRKAQENASFAKAMSYKTIEEGEQAAAKEIAEQFPAISEFSPISGPVSAYQAAHDAREDEIAGRAIAEAAGFEEEESGDDSFLSGLRSTPMYAGFAAAVPAAMEAVGWISESENQDALLSEYKDLTDWAGGRTTATLLPRTEEEEREIAGTDDFQLSVPNWLMAPPRAALLHTGPGRRYAEESIALGEFAGLREEGAAREFRRRTADMEAREDFDMFSGGITDDTADEEIEKKFKDLSYAQLPMALKNKVPLPAFGKEIALRVVKDEALSDQLPNLKGLVEAGATDEQVATYLRYVPLSAIPDDLLGDVSSIQAADIRAVIDDRKSIKKEFAGEFTSDLTKALTAISYRQTGGEVAESTPGWFMRVPLGVITAAYLEANLKFAPATAVGAELAMIDRVLPQGAKDYTRAAFKSLFPAVDAYLPDEAISGAADVFSGVRVPNWGGAGLEHMLSDRSPGVLALRQAMGMHGDYVPMRDLDAPFLTRMSVALQVDQSSLTGAGVDVGRGLGVEEGTLADDVIKMVGVGLDFAVDWEGLAAAPFLGAARAGSRAYDGWKLLPDATPMGKAKVAGAAAFPHLVKGAKDADAASAVGRVAESVALKSIDEGGNAFGMLAPHDLREARAALRAIGIDDSAFVKALAKGSEAAGARHLDGVKEVLNNGTAATQQLRAQAAYKRTVDFLDQMETAGQITAAERTTLLGFFEVAANRLADNGVHASPEQFFKDLHIQLGGTPGPRALLDDAAADLDAETFYSQLRKTILDRMGGKDMDPDEALKMIGGYGSENPKLEAALVAEAKSLAALEALESGDLSSLSPGLRRAIDSGRTTIDRSIASARKRYEQTKLKRLRVGATSDGAEVTLQRVTRPGEAVEKPLAGDAAQREVSDGKPAGASVDLEDVEAGDIVEILVPGGQTVKAKIRKRDYHRQHVIADLLPGEEIRGVDVVLLDRESYRDRSRGNRVETRTRPVAADASQQARKIRFSLKTKASIGTATLDSLGPESSYKLVSATRPGATPLPSADSGEVLHGVVRSHGRKITRGPDKGQKVLDVDLSDSPFGPDEQSIVLMEGSLTGSLAISGSEYTIIESARPGEAGGKKWRSSADVKEEEILNSGIIEMLERKKAAGERVTRQELLDQLTSRTPIIGVEVSTGKVEIDRLADAARDAEKAVSDATVRAQGIIHDIANKSDAAHLSAPTPGEEVLISVPGGQEVRGIVKKINHIPRSIAGFMDEDPGRRQVVVELAPGESIEAQEVQILGSGSRFVKSEVLEIPAEAGASSRTIVFNLDTMESSTSATLAEGLTSRYYLQRIGKAEVGDGGKAWNDLVDGLPTRQGREFVTQKEHYGLESASAELLSQIKEHSRRARAHQIEMYGTRDGFEGSSAHESFKTTWKDLPKDLLSAVDEMLEADFLRAQAEAEYRKISKPQYGPGGVYGTQYVTPGGKNYKEWKFTWKGPINRPEPPAITMYDLVSADTSVKMETSSAAASGIWGGDSPDLHWRVTGEDPSGGGRIVGEWADSKEDAIYEFGLKVRHPKALQRKKMLAKKDPVFQSHNWRTPGIFAHKRTQEFEVEGGQGALHAGEFQSDHATDLDRVKGGLEKKREVYQERVKRNEERLASDQLMEDDGRNLEASPGWRDRDDDEQIAIRRLTKKKLDRAKANLAEVERQLRFEPGSVIPGAGSLGAHDAHGEIAVMPFRTSWHNYLLKRMLRHAAERDLDFVTWNTGRQQQDRYELTAEAVGIRYDGRSDTYEWVEPPSGDPLGYEATIADAYGEPLTLAQIKEKWLEKIGQENFDELDRRERLGDQLEVREIAGDPRWELTLTGYADPVAFSKRADLDEMKNALDAGGVSYEVEELPGPPMFGVFDLEGKQLSATELGLMPAFAGRDRPGVFFAREQAEEKKDLNAKNYQATVTWGDTRRFGGEGKVALYDNTIVNTLKRLTGITPKKVKIRTEDGSNHRYRVEQRPSGEWVIRQMAIDNVSRPLHRYATEAEANAKMAELAAEYKSSPDRFMEVWGVELTPEMKRRYLKEGQPLYQKEGEEAGVAGSFQGRGEGGVPSDGKPTVDWKGNPLTRPIPIHLERKYIDVPDGHVPEVITYRLRHYSTTEDIDVLSSRYHGTGHKGEETSFGGRSERKNYLKRLQFYTAGQAPEQIVVRGSHASYDVSVDAALYDFVDDPLKIMPHTQRLFKTMPNGDAFNEMERIISDLGYDGHIGRLDTGEQVVTFLNSDVKVNDPKSKVVLGLSNVPGGARGLSGDEVDVALGGELQVMLVTEVESLLKEFPTLEYTIENAGGVWQGDSENAALLHVTGPMDEIRAFGAAWAVRKNQDATGLFRAAADGEEATEMFVQIDIKSGKQATLGSVSARLHELGFLGASVVRQPDGTSRVIVSVDAGDTASGAKLAAYSKEVGGSLSITDGVAEWLGQGDIDRYYRAARAGISTAEVDAFIATQRTEGVDHVQRYIDKQEEVLARGLASGGGGGKVGQLLGHVRGRRGGGPKPPEQPPATIGEWLDTRTGAPPERVTRIPQPAVERPRVRRLRLPKATGDGTVGLEHLHAGVMEGLPVEAEAAHAVYRYLGIEASVEPGPAAIPQITADDLDSLARSLRVEPPEMGGSSTEEIMKQAVEMAFPGRGTYVEADAAGFLAARKAQGGKDAFLSDLSVEDLAGSKMYLGVDGLVGYVMSPDGDLQNVFNNDGRGAGRSAVIHAIENGGVSMDCFDGFLPTYYKSFGFVESGRIAWDDAYMPEGWDLDKYGRPDVVYFKWGEGDRANAEQDYVARRVGKSRSRAEGDGSRAEGDGVRSDQAARQGVGREEQGAARLPVGADAGARARVAERSAIAFGGKASEGAVLGVKVAEGVEAASLADALAELELIHDRMIAAKKDMSPEDFDRAYSEAMSSALIRLLSGRAPNYGAMRIAPSGVSPKETLYRAKELVEAAAHEMGMVIESTFYAQRGEWQPLPARQGVQVPKPKKRPGHERRADGLIMYEDPDRPGMLFSAFKPLSEDRIARLTRHLSDEQMAPILEATTADGLKRALDAVREAGWDSAEIPTVEGMPATLMARLPDDIPDLTVAEKKGTLTKSTNKKNLVKQLFNLDRILAMWPGGRMFDSVVNWLRFQYQVTGKRDVVKAPARLMAYRRDPAVLSAELQRMSPKQISETDAGLEKADQFFQLFTSGRAGPEITGQLALWGILSRGLSPFPHEAAWIDAVLQGVDQWTLLAHQGRFDAAALERYLVWVESVIPSVPDGYTRNSPGGGGKSNLNDFGKHFLLKMSKPFPAGHVHAGRAPLAVFHDMICDSTKSGRQIRREWMSLADKPGIGLKVVSFLLVVTGRKDVIVIDRVQARHFWDAIAREAEYGTRHVYDGLGKPSGDARRNNDPRTWSRNPGIVKLLDGARGLAIYEAMEDGMAPAIAAAYAAIGRPDQGFMSRFHWDTWVINGDQEAAHASLAALHRRALGEEDPYVGAYSKEGKYNEYNFGFHYVNMGGGSKKRVLHDSGGTPYVFDRENYAAFIKEVRNHSKSKTDRGISNRGLRRIVPYGFSIRNDLPPGISWRQADGVDLTALDEAIYHHGRAPTDAEAHTLQGAGLAGAGGSPARGAGGVGGPDALHSTVAGDVRGSFEMLRSGAGAKWLVKIFGKGDMDTVFHEVGGHMLRFIMGPQWSSDLMRVFESRPLSTPHGSRRVLTRLGEEQAAESFRWYLRTRMAPSGEIARLMDQLTVGMSHLWMSIRPHVVKRSQRMADTGDAAVKRAAGGVQDLPYIPPEMVVHYDRLLRPEKLARRFATDFQVSTKPHREPFGSVTIPDDPEEAVAAGRVRAAGASREATRLTQRSREVLQALDMKAGEVYGSDVIASKVIGHIMAERMRQKMSAQQLTRLTTRTIVPIGRVNRITNDVTGSLTRALGGELKGLDVVQVRDPDTGEMVDGVVLSGPQSLGVELYASRIAAEPMGNIVPPRLYMATPTEMTLKELNTLQEAAIDVTAGLAARRSRPAEGLPESFGYSIWQALTGATDRLGEVSGHVARAKAGVERALVVKMPGEGMLNPDVQEIVNESLLAIGDAHTWALRMARDIKKRSPGNTIAETYRGLASMLDVPVRLASSSTMMRVLDAFDHGPAKGKDMSLEWMFRNRSTLNNLLYQGRLGQSAEEVAALAVVLNLGPVVRKLSDTEMLQVRDAVKIVHRGIQRRWGLIEDRAGDIALSLAGSRDSNVLINLRSEELLEIYQNFYSGDWKKLVEWVSQRGLDTGLESGRAPRTDLSTSFLEIIVRLRAGHIVSGLSEKLAKYGVTSRMQEMMADYKVGDHIDRDMFLKRVEFYIHNEISFKSAQVSTEPGPHHHGLRAAKRSPPSPPLSPEELAKRKNWLTYDILANPHDMEAYTLARKILNDWGFKIGKGTWTTKRMPDGSEVLLPDVIAEAIDDHLDRAAAVGTAWGSAKSGAPDRVGLPVDFDIERDYKVKRRMAQGAALDAIIGAFPASTSAIKQGITVGALWVVNAAYYTGAAIGAAFQAMMGLGPVRGSWVSIKNPLAASAVVMRLAEAAPLDAIKRMLPKIDAPPVITKDGRIYTTQMLYDLARREGLNSSYLHAETANSLAREIARLHKPFWKKMMAAPRHWQKLLIEAATAIDNYFRVSVFIDALQRGESPAAAAEFARHVGYDYGKLTDWERSKARHVVMFYTYMRRNMDLFWHTLLTRPSRAMGQLRLAKGLHEAYTEEDTSIVVPSYYEGRLMLAYRKAAKKDRATVGQIAAMTAPLPVPDAMMVLFDLFDAVSDKEARRQLVMRLTPWTAGVAVAAGVETDLFTGRALRDVSEVPDWLVALDRAWTGGIVVDDILRIMPNHERDPSRWNRPSDGMQYVVHPDRALYWWTMKNLGAGIPGMGRMQETVNAMDRSNLGLVEAVVNFSRKHAPYSESIRPGDTLSPRSGLTELEELMGFFGIKPVKISSFDRGIAYKREEAIREAGELEKKYKEALPVIDD